MKTNKKKLLVLAKALLIISSILAINLSYSLGIVKPDSIFDSDSGYINPNELPNSLKLLPEPPGFNPIEGSSVTQNNADWIISTQITTEKYNHAERYQQAINDAELSPEHFAEIYSKELGITISKQCTPRIFQIIKKVFDDAGQSTALAKSYYKRVRPFVRFNMTSCAPNQDDHLRQNGSYPSGHTTAGMLVALTLAQIDPANQEKIIKRGRDYGYSRLICLAHWLSDINAGIELAGADFARLQLNKNFQTDITKAKYELSLVRDQKFSYSQGAVANLNCSAQNMTYPHFLGESLC